MPTSAMLQATNATELLTAVKTTIEQDLITFFSQIDMPENLAKAVRYACLNGGKRVRPALCFASFITCKQMTQPLANQIHVQTKVANSIDDVRRAALALEMLHGYSLVHDDLPCMDDDDLRRGKPTCHIVYGENTALLAGDILQSLAFEVLTATIANWQPAQYSQALLACFAPKARRMVTGQMRDLNAENCQINQQQLEQIHQDKTGALIEAAVQMGAICAGVNHSVLADLNQAAHLLGLAFQVQDDILDMTASTENLGKPAGSDEKLNKSTYPKLMGLTHAQTYADKLFYQAKQLIIQLNLTDDNQTVTNNSTYQPKVLLNLVDWLWQRQH